jgi:hypothetical protein
MTKLHQAILYRALPFVAASAGPLDALATDSPLNRPVTGEFKQPAWLTDLSLGLKESYDDNVFLSGVDQKYLPASYNVPAGSVAALKDLGSWVTTVSPKIGFNFAPLLGDERVLQTLALTYAPDFAIYHDQASESYDAHRFVTAIKGGTGGLACGVDDTFTYVHGSDYGPTYPGGFVSAYNTAADRERREQIQNRANITIQYDCNQWFIRPTTSWLYYDFMTRQINVTGYQNYSDRYDINGGADAGYKTLSKLAVTLGYRYGHQYQQQFSFSPYSSSSDYQRVLVGLEGSPWKWLTLKIQGGPDFRDYAGDTATHITPVTDKHKITYYGESLVTATITSKDTLAFKYKQWQWVSSTGKIPYFESCYDLSYHRKLTQELGLDLGGRLLSSDYNSGNLPMCKRDDWQYTVSAGVGYAFNPHLNVNLAYSLDLGRNEEAGVVNAPTREYNHQLVSLGAQYKF